MVNFKDLTGHVFHRLKVVSRAANYGTEATWNCLCECGNTSVVRGSALRNGSIKSCGCWRVHRINEWNRNRGEWHGYKSHPLYQIWRGMIRRCYTSTDKKYPDYGGRGIRICDSWRNLEQFARDVGERPGPHYSLDRIDNDKNYEPGNVRWATHSEQMRNRRSMRRLEDENRRLREEIKVLRTEIEALKEPLIEKCRTA